MFVNSQGLMQEVFADITRRHLGLSIEIVVANDRTDPGRREADIASESLRDQEVARIERLITFLDDKAQTGDPKAISEIRQLSTQKSKLIGIEAPSKIEHTGRVDHHLIDAEQLKQIDDGYSSRMPADVELDEDDIIELPSSTLPPAA